MASFTPLSIKPAFTSSSLKESWPDEVALLCCLVSPMYHNCNRPGTQLLNLYESVCAGGPDPWGGVVSSVL